MTRFLRSTSAPDLQAHSDRCWRILQSYWVIPPPPDTSTLDVEGYCVVCGTWIAITDPETSPCPQRYLSPHAEILPFVVEALQTLKGDDGWLSTADLRKASVQGRKLWKAAGKQLNETLEIEIECVDPKSKSLFGVIRTTLPAVAVTGIVIEKDGDRRFEVQRAYRSSCRAHPDTENWLHAEVTEIEG